MKRRNLLKAAALAGFPMSLMPISSTLFAEEKYPSKPVELIVPQPPGGDADAICRTIQPALQQALGQSVVIENKPGAAGSIGTALGARAEPDGYTITFVNQGTMAFNPTLYAHPGYKVQDFDPIVWLASVNLVIVAKPSLPVQNLKDFLALARKNPGKYTFGSAGNGSANHLAAAMLKSMANVNLLHVPYRGGGPALIALMGGEIDTLVAFPLAALPQIKAGKLKALAVTGPKRSPSLPDVPTVAESGVSGYEFLSWFGLVGPKGTPKNVIDTVYTATKKALEVPAVKDRLEASLTMPVGKGPKEFSELIARESSRWSDLIKQYDVHIG